MAKTHTANGGAIIFGANGLRGKAFEDPLAQFGPLTGDGVVDLQPDIAPVASNTDPHRTVGVRRCRADWSPRGRVCGVTQHQWP